LTASQIADLKFQQFEDSSFDFGTNTGNAEAFADANFGSEVFLQKGTEALEFQKLVEAAKAAASPVFGGTSNFANPEFPITLGEAFLGKSGTVVSQSVHNLTDAQLKDFVMAFS